MSEANPDQSPGAGSVDPADHPPIPLPDADWAWFSERCAALGIADPTPKRAAIEALHGHLMGVNAWLNLTRIATPRDYLKNHVLDSLTGATDTRLRQLAAGAPCVDLGSGGGYPGLPLALWHPHVPWALLDARRKKAEFLAAAGKLAQRHGAGPVAGHHLRGGDAKMVPSLYRRCQLVVSRAMGQAVDVLAEAGPLLRHHGHCLIYKGPAFLGAEETTAKEACVKMGYRYVGTRTVTLEDGDPQRLLVTFERSA